MVRALVRCFVFATALAWVAPVAAGTPYLVKIACAVGGKKFEHVRTASYSTWGTRLDGKPYGSWEFPNPLPVCPDNGLVMFDEFSKAQVATLARLIADPEYRVMTDRDTPYYRAHWLHRRLEGNPVDTAWLLIQASWEADGAPDLKRRYQQEYVAAIRGLPREGDVDTWTIMQLRAVNGLRELGDFEAAQALLASVPLAEFDVPVPEEHTDGTTPSGLGKVLTNYEEIRAAKRKRGFLAQAETLRRLIAERDAASEPLRLMPAREAAARCKSEAGSLSEADTAFCRSEDMKTAMTE